MAFLKGCIPGYSDGFARMDHAMEPQKPIAQSLAKPLTVPPSSQEGGQGVGPNLKDCIPGYSDGFARMDHAMEMRPIPPAPFPTRKGGAYGFLEGLYPWLF